MCHRLYNYVEELKILYPLQFAGFREKMFDYPCPYFYQ